MSMDHRPTGFGARTVIALFGLAACLTLAAAGPALAVPDLQVFIPGATWDPSTETWVTTAGDFDLQIIAANNSLEGVNVVAGLASGVNPSEGTVTMTPVGFSGGPQTSFVYGTPIMGNGHALPGGGVYPTYHTILPIGDFTPTVPVLDMEPGETGTALGQIKVVHISITGFQMVHFNAYNHVEGTTRARFAPFSHDAEHTPEPGSLVLLLTGGAVLAVCARSRRRVARR